MAENLFLDVQYRVEMLMGVTSLLPIGIIQTIANMNHGLWYARSPELLYQDFIQNLVWIRAIGDTIFAVGAAALAWFVIGLITGRSYADNAEMKKAA